MYLHYTLFLQHLHLLITWALVACEAHFHHLNHKWPLCLQIKDAQYTELNINMFLCGHTAKSLYSDP